MTYFFWNNLQLATPFSFKTDQLQWLPCLIFKRQTFVACAILLLMLERNALLPLEVNLKKETSTLLWYWPCSGKLPCFPLPTSHYQCEMFTSRIRLNGSFLRSLSLVLSMYISEKKRAISLTNKATCTSCTKSINSFVQNLPSLWHSCLGNTQNAKRVVVKSSKVFTEAYENFCFAWSPHMKV